MTEQQKINWKRSGDIPVLQDVSKGAVHMLQFPLLEQQSWISHGFSTRMGGVSEGCYASMNLSFTKGDDPKKVRENYRRMADMLEMDMERMTLSFQTHTTNVRLVTEEDAGKGIVKERDYTDVDGLITNIPGHKIGRQVAEIGVQTHAHRAAGFHSFVQFVHVRHLGVLL